MDRFKYAVAIVSNNDARYQINKDRARFYCANAQQPLRWAAAVDHASSQALQAEACDKPAKIRPGGNDADKDVCMLTYYNVFIYG